MKNKIKRFLECLLVFMSVGTLYFIGECIWKNRPSHWSMLLLSGGISLVAMLLNDRFRYEMDFLLQIIICTITTLIGEYLVGITLNRDYSIWDYRELPFSINGQVSLYFAFLWFVLMTFLIPILDYVEWKFFDYKKDTPPYYKVFGKVIFQFKSKEVNL